MTTERQLEIQVRHFRWQLEQCDQMLTDAGVPEWVENSNCNGVPGNSTPERLKWYLARRKDVKPGETDRKLAKEMEENIEAARLFHMRTKFPMI